MWWWCVPCNSASYSYLAQTTSRSGAQLQLMLFMSDWHCLLITCVGSYHKAFLHSPPDPLCRLKDCRRKDPNKSGRNQVMGGTCVEPPKNSFPSQSCSTALLSSLHFLFTVTRVGRMTFRVISQQEKIFEREEKKSLKSARRCVK